MLNKYKDYSTKELMDVIDKKNHMIYSLNGKIYCLSHKVENYKQKIQNIKNNSTSEDLAQS